MPGPFSEEELDSRLQVEVEVEDMAGSPVASVLSTVWRMS